MRWGNDRRRKKYIYIYEKERTDRGEEKEETGNERETLDWGVRRQRDGREFDERESVI
jgi:hypothetical protein